MEIEKDITETTRKYLPIFLYNTIMLLIKNERHINLDTLCNYFPFYALNASMILIEKENHIIMETTCKKFSISLFNAMMLLMGKEKHIYMRRTEIDVYDKLYNEACSKHIRRVNTGSRKEGFRIDFSDLDCFYFSTRHRVVWSLTDMHSYDPVTESVILVEYHPSIPGTVYLRLKESCSKNTDLINKIKVVEKNSRRNMYIRHFGILQMKDPQSYNCGSDFAYGYTCGQWPLQKYDFMARCRKFGWPAKNTLENMVSSGCFFAPIGSRQSRHDNDPNSDIEWRLSFVQAENVLVRAMNHCQFLCYALLKKFLSNVLDKNAKKEEKFPCSYYIKTAMFWCIQTDPGYEWSKENFFECFWKCYKLLLHVSWVYAGYCPNFFIPQNNLFVCKIIGADQERLFTEMYKLYNRYCSRKKCLSKIPVLQEALGYGANSQLTKSIFKQVHFTDRLIAEAIDDINNLQCQDIIYAWKALYLYEISPIDTSNIEQILITMHVFNIFHDIALSRQSSCHCKTKCKNNRQVYKNHKKVGFSLLKLTSKYGPSSDPLYLALFWYIDGNYLHSLYILDQIRRRLHQDHVFFWDNDYVEQSYTRKMQGKRMSVRIKEGMAFWIYIYSNSSFSELNFEISVLRKPENPACLAISPFVFTEFLIFLCHHRLKSPKADRSIQALHSFLKRDNDRYVGRGRDIAWDILGICHHMSGNLALAFSAYEESLNETSISNLNVAVKKRIARIADVLIRMGALPLDFYNS